MGIEKGGTLQAANDPFELLRTMPLILIGYRLNFHKSPMRPPLLRSLETSFGVAPEGMKIQYDEECADP